MKKAWIFGIAALALVLGSCETSLEPELRGGAINGDGNRGSIPLVAAPPSIPVQATVDDLYGTWTVRTNALSTLVDNFYNSKVSYGVTFSSTYVDYWTVDKDAAKAASGTTVGTSSNDGGVIFLNGGTNVMTALGGSSSGDDYTNVDITGNGGAGEDYFFQRKDSNGHTVYANTSQDRIIVQANGDNRAVIFVEKKKNFIDSPYSLSGSYPSFSGSVNLKNPGGSPITTSYSLNKSNGRLTLDTGITYTKQ